MKKIALSFLSILLATVDTIEAGSFKTLPTISETPGYSYIELDARHNAKDIFNHFVSECGPSGKLLFLGTLRDASHLRLTLLSANEAAGYIETDGDGKYPWLLACDGEEKFLVEKDQQYGNKEAKVRLYKGRALEGIDYAQERSSAPAVLTAAQTDEGYTEKLATDLAWYKMSFVGTHQGTRFEGRYENKSGSCDMVSVTRVASDNATTQSFKVCSGTVYPLTGPVALNSAR